MVHGSYQENCKARSCYTSEGFWWRRRDSNQRQRAYEFSGVGFAAVPGLSSPVGFWRPQAKNRFERISATERGWTRTSANGRRNGRSESSSVNDGALLFEEGELRCPASPRRCPDDDVTRLCRQVPSRVPSRIVKGCLMLPVAASASQSVTSVDRLGSARLPSCSPDHSRSGR